MSNRQTGNRRASVLVVVFAILIFVAVVLEGPLSRSRWLGMLAGLPAFAALLVPDDSRWRWLLYGVAVGLYVASLLCRYVFS